MEVEGLQIETNQEFFLVSCPCLKKTKIGQFLLSLTLFWLVSATLTDMDLAALYRMTAGDYETR